MLDSPEALNCNNVCTGCPAAIGLGFREQELFGHVGPSMSQARHEMQVAELSTAMTALNTATGQVACKHIEKDLPDTPDTIPAVGSPELIDYASQCPSFLTYIQLRTI